MDLEDEAYWWAHNEQVKSGCALPSITMVSIKGFYIRDDRHASLFHAKGEPHALFRDRFYSSGELVYRLIENYDEMAAESPDLVDMLLRSGNYAFQKAMAKTVELKLIHLQFFR